MQGNLSLYCSFVLLAVVQLSWGHPESTQTLEARKAAAIETIERYANATSIVTTFTRRDKSVYVDLKSDQTRHYFVAIEKPNRFLIQSQLLSPKKVGSPLVERRYVSDGLWLYSTDSRFPRQFTKTVAPQHIDRLVLERDFAFTGGVVSLFTDNLLETQGNIYQFGSITDSRTIRGRNATVYHYGNSEITGNFVTSYTKNDFFVDNTGIILRSETEQLVVGQTNANTEEHISTELNVDVPDQLFEFNQKGQLQVTKFDTISK